MQILLSVGFTQYILRNANRNQSNSYAKYKETNKAYINDNANGT